MRLFWLGTGLWGIFVCWSGAMEIPCVASVRVSDAEPPVVEVRDVLGVKRGNFPGYSRNAFLLFDLGDLGREIRRAELALTVVRWTEHDTVELEVWSTREQRDWRDGGILLGGVPLLREKLGVLHGKLDEPMVVEVTAGVQSLENPARYVTLALRSSGVSEESIGVAGDTHSRVDFRPVLRLELGGPVTVREGMPGRAAEVLVEEPAPREGVAGPVVAVEQTKADSGGPGLIVLVAVAGLAALLLVVCGFLLWKLNRPTAPVE